MCEVKYCRRILDGVEHWGKEMKEKIRKQDSEGLLEGVGRRRLWRSTNCHIPEGYRQ